MESFKTWALGVSEIFVGVALAIFLGGLLAKAGTETHGLTPTGEPA
jgi:hypothetical protein